MKWLHIALIFAQILSVSGIIFLYLRTKKYLNSFEENSNITVEEVEPQFEKYLNGYIYLITATAILGIAKDIIRDIFL